MSSIVKYNDFIQINPDSRILSLDKEEKVLLTDNLITRAHNEGRGLIITYDLSHSGRKINNRIYSTKGQQKGIDSLTHPYPKPILRNHDQGGEPIGRFIGGEWQSLSSEASSFLNSTQSMLDIHNAFTDDKPEKIYHTLKKLNLLDNKDWPGLGRMRVQANITDETAIKKFMDGRYLTFSAGSTTDRHVCSICESDWAQDGMCEHRHGKVYDDETCVFITGDFIVLEGSVVNTPADDLSQMVSMEFADDSNVDNAKESLSDFCYSKEIILSDSSYELESKVIVDQEQSNIQEEPPSGSDINCNPVTLTEVAVTEKEESMSKDQSLVIEDATESADSEQASQEVPASTEVNIDWNVFDLAFQTVLAQQDIKPTQEERDALPDAFFCGPDRTFPISDASQTAIAKDFIKGYKGSEVVKDKILMVIDEKAALFASDEADLFLTLETKFNALQEKYNDLEEKFKVVLESIVKAKVEQEEEDSSIKNEENLDVAVEKVTNDALKVKEEAFLNELSVESPSVHTNDNEKKINDKLNLLGSFEKKVVVEFKQILADAGEIAATQYFASKSSYLPRGFNPNNF